MAKELTPIQSECMRVIEAVSFGERTSAAIKRLGINPIVFYETLAQSGDLQSKMAAAREASANEMVDETFDIADKDVDAARARNRISARQWVAARFARRTFGDKIDINVEGTVSIAAALEAAQARVLPYCDPARNAESQVIDLTAESVANPIDPKSDAVVDPFD